ncbi:MAG: threonine synthase [Oscillospiraceae bacterium]|nr:threonine synthase [Oscillospiraceae bacterium]
MLYHSTRNRSLTANSAEAVLEGLAPDGGLYMPEALPAFDWQKCLGGTSLTMSADILGALLPEIDHMQELVNAAYADKFETDDLTPTVSVGEFSVLELFRGPTAAFKDVALSVLPRLLTSAKAKCGVEEDILILTATSGDTGKAALEGFKNVDGIRICVFYPDGGVSPVQRKQMVTQEGNNVIVCAVEGNFDDAQTGVKNIFNSFRDKDLPFRLSSANSINIGRLAPQIMYYFRAYADLIANGTIELGDEVNFSVPTGNFGDILAGYIAKKLGLPVGMLICASNANNVLTDFIRTGVYDKRRALLKTQSPSMDILVSSNLERLLYLMSGDTELVSSLMAQLNEQGVYSLPDELKQAVQAEFWAGCCSDEQGREVIDRVWNDYAYLCDPHTAAGWAAAEEYRAATGDDRPMVVLSTASPYKFPAAVLQALGTDNNSSDEFKQMQLLNLETGVDIPPMLADLEQKEELHLGVIPKDKMPEFVLSL